MKKETELTDFLFLYCNQFTNKVNMFIKKDSGSHFRGRKVLIEYRRVTEAVENYVNARCYIPLESMDLHFKTMLNLSNK